MTGTNDAAVIAGTSAITITETNLVLSTGGTLTITDVDSAKTFVAQTDVAGSNGYGKFSVTTAGVWTYKTDTAHDEFSSGKTYTDSLTVASADGTTKVVTVTINGSDDAAYIGGTSTATLTETDSIQSVGGTVAVMDVDSAVNNTFVAQTNVAKTYGSFTISTAGVWSYAMSTAHNEFVAGTVYTDSITVASATGLNKVITVTINGTNDAAVIGGVSTANLTETNVAQSTGGTLTITDADNTAAFVAQTAVAGSNGYGKFSVTAAGVWTYVMNTAHDEFLLNKVYTDSITVAAVDGTTKVVTVSITGTNDAPTLTYVDTGASSTDAITNSAAMTVSSLEASATWEYQVDGGVWTSGTGTSFNMSEGQHTYNARQKDSLNNVSGITTKTVTLDTVAPNAAGIALASDAGISNTDGVTNNGALNLSLSADTNNWQYSTNGGTTWVNGTGTTLGLGSGVYATNSIKVQAFDKAGNATVSSYAPALTVDTAAPTASVSINNTALRFGESTTVNFRFSEAVYGFDRNDVTVSGGSLSNITGSGSSYSATFTAGYSYNGGSYVSVNANTYTDQAGNNGGAGSTGSFRVGPNVAEVARGMSLYVTGFGHGWCDTQGWIGVGLWGNNDLQGATVTLYDGWGHSWSSNVAGSGGSTNFGTFSGGGNNLTQFHADITYAGQTASVGGGVAYQVTWRGLVGLGFFNCIKADNAYTFCYSSPIVLDLNGDGIQTVDTAHGVQFDMAGDGIKQSVGWVDKHDALLVRDNNHDGQINNGTELFGSDTILKNGEKAGDGWVALAEMDTNGDGKVDANDSTFAEIKVWVDANGDGLTDAGELRGLVDAGIQSIDVSHANSNITQNGNVLFGTGQFTKTDGNTSAMTDAWFQVGQTLELDFAQVLDQPMDMTDGKAQTLKLSLQDVLAHSATYGALQISGDSADGVLIVNGGQIVSAQSQVLDGQTFNAYDLNQDGMNDVLIHQAMHQAQFA
jgi:VCBS repeat-containing protein